MKKKMQNLYKIFMQTIAFLLLSVVAMAQSVISGKVTDSKDGAPVPGVTVTVKGTKTFAQTGADGTFKISVPSQSAILLFTSASYLRKEVGVAGQSVLELKLEQSNQQLSEVVVVGYGTQVRKYMTGSVSKIESKVLTSTPAPSFDAALQGRAPGLQVQQANGSLGGAVRIRVRGTSSISGSGDPLYVVDGIPFANGDNQAGFGSGLDATKANNQNPL
ncbi:MAG: carboxypeptidase-like regulatory domain-containing protein, partial [Ferruginibacter sp.]|nr:carboxypeptidase-like regulatory domain-containing protein [Ferruginibacter sp.]